MNWLGKQTTSSSSASSQPQEEERQATSHEEEKIRQKRLARFQSLVQQRAPTEGSVTDTKTHKENEEEKKTARKQQDKDTNKTVPEDSDGAKIGLSKTKKHPSTSSQVDDASSTTQNKTVFNLEQLEDQIITRTLRITLKEQNASEQVVWMKDFLEEGGSSDAMGQNLSKDIIDRILFERLLQFQDTVAAPLNYLIESYQRAGDQESLLSISSSNSEQKKQLIETVQYMKTLCLSYLDILLSNSELFQTDSPIHRSAHFKELLIENKLPAGLLKEMVGNLEKEEKEQGSQVIAEIFHPIMELLCSKAMQTSLVQANFVPALRALGELVALKPLAIQFTHHRNFILSEQRMSQPSITGRALETETLLGPFFRLTALKEDEQVAKTMFSNPSQRTRQDIEQSMSSLRSSLRVLRHGLCEIMLSLLRASPESRELVLQWFGQCLHFDKERAKLQANYQTLATDGFSLNVLAVLLLLAQPFSDPHSPKLDNIDGTFCVSKHRIDYSGETRLAVDSEELARWVDPKNPNAQVSFQNMKRQQAMELAQSGTSFHSDQKTDSIQVKEHYNFISECFFLTLRACQLIFGGTVQMYEEHILRGIQHLQSAKRDMESRSSRMTGPLASIMEARLKEVNRQLDLLLVAKLSYDVYLQDEECEMLLLQFGATVGCWLLRVGLGDQPKDDLQNIHLPLPTPPPTLLCSLPEHTVQVIADAFLYAARFCPWILDSVSFIQHDVLCVMCAILSSPLYVRNPYLRAKFVEFLWAVLGDPPSTHNPHEEWHNRVMSGTAAIESNMLCQKYLPGALIRFYVEVEHTGSHSQFYDKFSIRYHITCIFDFMWHISNYRSCIRSEAENEAVFVKFVNMLLNDATFLLDEALSDLTEIHSLQDRLANRQEADNSSTEIQELESRLSQLERQVKSYNLLSHSSVHMLHFLTEDDRVRRVFTRPEMINRLAEMLNYFLLLLCGPKCQSLVVRNREQYAWEPRVLLTQIIGIYLHFQNESEFIQSVAKDGRSYSAELFQRVLDTVVRRRLLSEDDCNTLTKLIDQFKAYEQQENEEDYWLQNAPEEFLDPIMATIMKDPVLLPTSRTIVDRSTISRHLLSDPSDPFNREFLSMDMVQPQEELKQRIEVYLAKHASVNRNKNQ
eukprot:jgi/Galph1/1575/GphlegSOOS_G266.1